MRALAIRPIGTLLTLVLAALNILLVGSIPETSTSKVRKLMRTARKDIGGSVTERVISRANDDLVKHPANTVELDPEGLITHAADDDVSSLAKSAAALDDKADSFLELDPRGSAIRQHQRHQHHHSHQHGSSRSKVDEQRPGSQKKPEKHKRDGSKPKEFLVEHSDFAHSRAPSPIPDTKEEGKEDDAPTVEGERKADKKTLEAQAHPKVADHACTVGMDPESLEIACAGKCVGSNSSDSDWRHECFAGNLSNHNSTGICVWRRPLTDAQEQQGNYECQPSDGVHCCDDGVDIFECDQCPHETVTIATVPADFWGPPPPPTAPPPQTPTHDTSAVTSTGTDTNASQVTCEEFDVPCPAGQSKKPNPAIHYCGPLCHSDNCCQADDVNATEAEEAESSDELTPDLCDAPAVPEGYPPISLDEKVCKDFWSDKTRKINAIVSNKENQTFDVAKDVDEPKDKYGKVCNTNSTQGGAGILHLGRFPECCVIKGKKACRAQACAHVVVNNNTCAHDTFHFTKDYECFCHSVVGACDKQRNYTNEPFDEKWAGCVYTLSEQTVAKVDNAVQPTVEKLLSEGR